VAAGAASIADVTSDPLVNPSVPRPSPEGWHYGCATHRCKGTCSNDLKVKREDLEQRVLAGLKERLLAPERVEQFTRMF
jgi:hypothetical protein